MEEKVTELEADVEQKSGDLDILKIEVLNSYLATINVFIFARSKKGFKL